MILMKVIEIFLELFQDNFIWSLFLMILEQIHHFVATFFLCNRYFR